MSDKQHDDTLMEAYRRASASDADRPRASTRAAILAQAAATARRNAPAANESRYWLRAVAGIAVLGIGVVLWRQTDYHLPVEAPVVESTPEPDRNVVKQSAADSLRAGTVGENEQPLSQPFPASPATISPPSPPPKAESSARQLAQNTDDDELEEFSITGARIQMPAEERAETASAAPFAPPRVGGAALAGGAAGLAQKELDSTALLRQHFPAQYQSDASHSVWVVLNAAGDVLQSGELATGQRVADLAPQLARALSERVPGPWQMQTVQNARGQTIELYITRLP
jgi:hypothetical protein